MPASRVVGLGRRGVVRLLTALFMVVPGPVRRRMAPQLSTVPQLGWVPGWRFGAGDAEATIAGLLRLALWRHCARRRIPERVVIRWYDGLRVETYLGNDLSLCLFVGGAYEPNEFMLLSRVLRPGMFFVDVGSNDGLYALFAARRVAPDGRVMALEPSRREFARLQRNLALNRITNIVALPVAAGERAGTGELRIAGFGHEGQNTLGGFAYDIEAAGVETVRVAPLDRLVQDEAFDRVDVVKIDAEGAELGVLRGACGILSRHRPLVMLELLQAALRQQGASRADVVELLAGHGYEFLSYGSSGRPERRPTMDLDGANIVAIHRENDLLEACRDE